MKNRKEIGGTKMGTGKFVAGVVGGVFMAVWTACVFSMGVVLGYDAKEYSKEQKKLKVKAGENDAV